MNRFYLFPRLSPNQYLNFTILIGEFIYKCPRTTKKRISNTIQETTQVGACVKIVISFIVISSPSTTDAATNSEEDLFKVSLISKEIIVSTDVTFSAGSIMTLYLHRYSWANSSNVQFFLIFALKDSFPLSEFACIISLVGSLSWLKKIFNGNCFSLRWDISDCGVIQFLSFCFEFCRNYGCQSNEKFQRENTTLLFTESESKNTA